MVITNDEEIYHILLSLRAHGWTRNLPKENLVTELKVMILLRNRLNLFFQDTMLDHWKMSGAIGLQQLKKLPSFIKIRRKNAAFFRKSLKIILLIFNMKLESVAGLVWLDFKR